VVKIECEVCHKLGCLQQLGNYFRVRHYSGIDKNTGKSKFTYHQQSKEYAISQLENIKKGENLSVQHSSIGKCSSDLDLKLQKLGSKSQTRSGRSLAWFRTSACHVDDPGSNPGDRIPLPVQFYPTFILWVETRLNKQESTITTRF
jgi:hypothetical protein